MNDVTKQFEQFAEIMKAAVPQIKTNANGYEIRTKVLEFAQNQAWNDYHVKWNQFEITAKKDSDGQIVTSVKLPEAPGAETVLETAQKFYDFVSGTVTKTK